MTPVVKALWYIESHFGEAISLDEIADAAGCSRYYLSRAFGLAVGCSLSGYIRGRRLSEAARKLAADAPDILTVALEVGYNSHEAFTRAFRDQFGTTPEKLRAERTTDTIKLVEPILMLKASETKLEPPRMIDGKAMLIAGLSVRHAYNAGMPAQWQRFLPHFGHVPGQIGEKAYGVLYNGDDKGSVEYLTGVEVSDFSDLPAEFASLRIPVQRYAVFAHREHISSINQTWMTVFNEWIPDSGHELADAPQFELYGEDFDGAQGTGTVEIWIPLKV